jgi:hypothetical protein
VYGVVAAFVVVVVVLAPGHVVVRGMAFRFVVHNSGGKVFVLCNIDNHVVSPG